MKIDWELVIHSIGILITIYLIAAAIGIAILGILALIIKYPIIFIIIILSFVTWAGYRLIYEVLVNNKEFENREYDE